MMKLRTLITSIIGGSLLFAIVLAEDITVYKPEGYTGMGPDKIVIQDRNLGATSNDITSKKSYGHYFQRGNNYGFTATSSSVGKQAQWNDSYIHKGYYGKKRIGPSSYIYDYWENDEGHPDLWGGEDDQKNAWGLIGIETTEKNRQGPCPLGYHIPSIGEWSKLFEYRCLGHVDQCSYKKIQYPDIDYNVIWYNDKNIGTYFASDLLIPLGGELLGDHIAREDDGFFWSSSVRNDESMFFTINSGDIDTSTHHGRVYGMNIRCFKNYGENEEIIEGSRREKLWKRLFD